MNGLDGCNGQKIKREEDSIKYDAIIERNKIGVFSLGRGAGATFIATSLAKKLAERQKRIVAFVELGRAEPSMSLTYHALGINHRFAYKPFISFHEELRKGNHIKKISNIDAGINWVLRTPSDLDLNINLTVLEELRLINNVKGEWIICDFGSNYSSETLDEMDLLFGVIDPLPSKLLSNKETYRNLRQHELSGRKLIWIVNRQNTGIGKKSLRQFLKEKNFMSFPLMPEEWFYSAQYHCQLPLEQPDIKRNIAQQIEELVNHHILFT